MAKLFLSYSRKDDAKAHRFCEWLESEGHEVWRDEDDIGGGTSFSTEIEKALNECDAVVALWSANSVLSAWVRDEAGFGRDAGKLIPISLDGSEPPLGFRQFQSIDVSKWRRQTAPPSADRIKNAIARIAGSRAAPLPQRPRRGKTRLPFSRSTLTVALASLVAVLAIATALVWRSSREPQPITIAVMPSPTSPDRSSAMDYANVAAADMAAFLPKHFDGATVIAPSDATVRTRGNRMLISANPHGRGVDASLTVSDTDGRTILWSKSWNVSDAGSVDLRQEISRSASRAALCLTEARGGRERLVQPALGLFMGGCVGIGDPQWSDADVLATFDRVVKLAPAFPRGWAYLAVGRAVAVQDGSPAASVKSARQAIAMARKLNPQSGMAYLAEEMLIPDDLARVLALLEKGAELEPDNAMIQLQRAEALMAFGRLSDSVDAATRAVELDPLSSFVRSEYITTLTYAGRFSRAAAEIAEAHKNWPNDPTIDFADFGFQYRYGDPRAAEKLMPRVLDYSDARLEPYRKLIAARLDPSPAKIDEAIRTWEGPSGGGNRNRFLLALGQFHRVDETFVLLDDPQFQSIVDPRILFRPEFAPVRADPRFMAVAARLGLVRYWRESGNWPDFCTTEQLKYDCEAEAAKFAKG